jgi:hypothetical protein
MMEGACDVTAEVRWTYGSSRPLSPTWWSVDHTIYGATAKYCLSVMMS